MGLKPFHARLAFAGFLAVGASTGVNLLYLQDPALVSSVARAKGERVRQRAEIERVRRLALEPKEAPAVRAMPAIAPVAPAVTPQALPVVSERAGRFAPTAGQLDRAVTPAAATAAESEPRQPEVVKSIQALLGQKGYEPGTADGVLGLVTRAAIMAYEHDQGLPLTAEPTESLLLHLRGVPQSQITAPRPRAGRSPNAEHLLRSVQQSLSQLGYFAAKIDGRNGEDTARAIREYEMDQGLVPTGRISAPLLMKLARSTSGHKSAQR